MKFTRSFIVKGDSEKAFDLAQKYFSGMNFKIVDAVKPILLVLERGTKLGSWTSFKIENVKTKLTISFAQKEGNVNVLCDYDITHYSIISSGDTSTLESEVEHLKNYLETLL